MLRTSPIAHFTEWKKFSGIKFEIQIRTVLQHAWSAISHKLEYKTVNDVPKKMRRQLFRISALLEIGDQEFSSLRQISENEIMKLE